MPDLFKSKKNELVLKIHKREEQGQKEIDLLPKGTSHVLS